MSYELVEAEEELKLAEEAVEYWAGRVIELRKENREANKENK